MPTYLPPTALWWYAWVCFSAAPAVWNNLPMSPPPWFSISLQILFENIFFSPACAPELSFALPMVSIVCSLKYPFTTGFCSILAWTYTLAGSMLYAVKHCGVHGLYLMRYRLKVGLNSQKLKYCCKAFFLQERMIGAKDSSTVSC